MRKATSLPRLQAALPASCCWSSGGDSPQLTSDSFWLATPVQTGLSGLPLGPPFQFATIQYLQFLLLLLHCLMSHSAALFSTSCPGKFQRSTACTGVLSDEAVSTHMHPARGTMVFLTPEPLPRSSQIPAHRQCCHTGLSEALPSPSGLQGSLCWAQSEPF